MSLDGLLEVEAEGETVGEAKWLGLRELEKLYPGLPRDLVTFEVVSEGERGLLGVGTTPARVLARFDPSTAPRPRLRPRASGPPPSTARATGRRSSASFSTRSRTRSARAAGSTSTRRTPRSRPASPGPTWRC